MAALLRLGRAFPSSLVRVGSPGSVIRNRLFMTSSTTAAIMEHTTLVRSISEMTSVFPSQARDEKFKVMVIYGSPEVINGNHCFEMAATIERGKWMVDFDLIAGPKTLLVKEVMICICDSNISRFKEFVESKGITKGDGKIDCFERRPGKK